jgi:hypothetical protein
MDFIVLPFLDLSDAVFGPGSREPGRGVLLERTSFDLVAAE